MSTNQIREVVSKQRTAEWFECRKCRLTSSNFGKIVKRRSNFYKLAKDMMDSKFFTNDAIEWGINNEKNAIREYEKKCKVNVIEGGFYVNDKYNYIGCSPDGLINDGLLEIKCPYSLRNGIFPLNPSSSFYCKSINGKLVLKKTHNYYYQIQGIMGIMNLKWCDFVIWTPSNMSIERIEFEAPFFDNVLIKLRDFYHSHYEKLII